MAIKDYPIVERLRGKSEKTQRYILRAMVGARRTSAQTGYEAAKRQFTQKLYGEPIGFGESNNNYGHRIAVKLTRDGRTGSILENTYLVKGVVDKWEMGQVGTAWQIAKERHLGAIDIIREGNYTDMTEVELQQMVYGIDRLVNTLVPADVRRSCGKCRGRRKPRPNNVVGYVDPH